jgi:hypothetical protein
VEIIVIILIIIVILAILVLAIIVMKRRNKFLKDCVLLTFQLKRLFCKKVPLWKGIIYKWKVLQKVSCRKKEYMMLWKKLNLK